MQCADRLAEDRLVHAGLIEVPYHPDLFIAVGFVEAASSVARTEEEDVLRLFEGSFLDMAKQLGTDLP